MLTSIVATASATEAHENWKLATDEDGIKVFTRGIEGSDYVEFKAESDFDATLQQVSGLVMSIPHMTKWMHGTKQVRLVSAVSPVDRILYLVQHAPFPLRDRDGFLRNTLSQREDGTVIYTMDLQRDRTIDSKYVHISQLRVRVTMTPLSSQKTHVEYRAYAEPGGFSPAWAVNKVAQETPYETLKSAKEVLRSMKGSLVVSSIRNYN